MILHTKYTGLRENGFNVHASSEDAFVLGLAALSAAEQGQVREGSSVLHTAFLVLIHLVLQYTIYFYTCTTLHTTLYSIWYMEVYCTAVYLTLHTIR